MTTFLELQISNIKVNIFEQNIAFNELKYYIKTSDSLDATNLGTSFLTVNPVLSDPSK